MEGSVVGRSGTGKTTCCLYRLWDTFQNYWTNADCDDDKCSTDVVHNNFTHVDSDDHKCSTDVVHNNITNADYDDDKCSPETEPLLDDGTTNYIVTKGN